MLKIFAVTIFITYYYFVESKYLLVETEDKKVKLFENDQILIVKLSILSTSMYENPEKKNLETYRVSQKKLHLFLEGCSTPKF